MTSKPLPPHGSVARRKHHGCTCPDCREARRVYDRNRKRAIVAGTWEPFVDAEPVRRHIIKLHAVGVSDARIGAITGLSGRSLACFTQPYLAPENPRGLRRSARKEVADKILAIPVTWKSASVVDATGTHRRIQALATRGWPQRHIGAHAGLRDNLISKAMARPRVTGRTARAVAELYDRVYRAKAERYGIDATSAKRARAQAARARWAPPSYWDRFPGAIDDPHFTPEYGKTKAELLAEEALWLIHGGVESSAVASRLGISADYLKQVMTRGRLGEAA
ncbi:hypothetical protein [Streptomyces sp. NPDC096033]|uniref:hypothetical protein n=1 Tax=Streptomyces sp. NPDC096033 TaxID=3366071 RepID=UPI00381EB3C5